MQEYTAKPDGGAVHEHELARHRDRPLFLERLMHAERLAAPIFGGLHAVGQTANAVFQQWPIDEARPDVERIDQLAREGLEAPGLVGVHQRGVVAAARPVIEVDHAAHEFGGEDTNAAVVEEIDAAALPALVEHRIVAEMRIAMDDAEAAEREPP